MNSQPSPSTSERDQQALDWWTRLRSDDVTAHERNTFELWRLDPLNTNVYKKCRDALALARTARSFAQNPHVC